jgi:hypothetical protein
MSGISFVPGTERREGHAPSARLFAALTLGLAALAALLAGWAPLGFSIVTVFLFAGPHNWIEARYFLVRLPGRWGKLRGFFILGLGGVLVLAVALVSISGLALFGVGARSYDGAFAGWLSALVVWVLVLVRMRSRQNPRRDWSWTVPAGMAVLAAVWLAPRLCGLGLVYLHPLMALWLLDREIRRSRPQWRRAYHACLLTLPLFLGVLWWRLADAPPLPGEDSDPLAWRIAWHAGKGALPGVPAHLLIATHTFLEMLHYAAWLVAIPLVGLRAAPWRLDGVPLARRSPRWRWLLGGLLAAGACVALVLWAAFLADYPLTRDVYFTAAIVHVLAEVPFLLRAL